MIFILLSAFLLSLSIPLSIAADHVAIAIGFLGLLLSYKEFKLDRFDLKVLSVSFVGLVSSLLSARPLYSILKSHYLWHFLPYFILSRVGGKRLKSIVVLLGLSSMVSALGVIVKAFTGFPPLKAFSHPHTIKLFLHPVLSSGFFTNHLTAAGIIGVIFLLFASYAVFCRDRVFELYSILVALVLFTGLVLTFCRSYWIGVFVAILLLPFIYRSRSSWFVSLSLIAASMVLYLAVPSIQHRVATIVHFKKDGSSMDRIALWRAGLNMYRHYSLKYKLIGCGSGNVYRFLKPYLIKSVKETFGSRNINAHLFSALHNEYLQILVKWGIIGLIVWLFLWGSVLWRNIVFLKRAKEGFYKATVLGLTLGFVAFLVGGFFEHNVGDAEVIIMIMFLLGLNKAILDSWKEGV